MASYTLLESRGDPISANYHLSMFLYPNTPAQDDDMSAMRYGLKDALDQCYDRGAIGYYEIYANYDYPDKPGQDRQTYFDQFDEWLGTNDDYKSYTGSHLGISGAFYGGLAHLGENQGNTSFSIAKTAVAGCLSGVQQYYKNVAIHEAFHPVININESSVSQLASEDHDLGKIYHSGPVSPMATGYEDTSTREGVCSNQYAWNNAYTTDLTTCTEDAVYYTARDEQ